MKVRVWIRIFALLVPFGAPATLASQESLPLRLLADAVERGCVPVTDTAAYPGLSDPLYRYGVYETGRDTLQKASAAYWCIMPTVSQGTSIVIWREWGDRPVPGGCLGIIPYRGNPGGLSFEARGTVALMGARLVDEPGRRGPRVAARGPVIVSRTPTRIARFICHTGRWYVEERSVDP